jgi:hypothetical protein
MSQPSVTYVIAFTNCTGNFEGTECATGVFAKQEHPSFGLNHSVFQIPAP